MKFIKLICLIIPCILLLPVLSIGQNESDIENTKISILTCRSGDQLYSTFGHTAIRIYNPKSKLDHVYNYGLFSFDTPNFYVKFMRGQLPYLLGATKMEYFLEEYHLDKRSIWEQELILNSGEKRQIINFLIENAKPENREYKYDFFFDNCATRVVDVFELQGNVNYKSEVKVATFRDLLKENLQNLVWSDFGIDLVIGARADRMTDRRDQMFLPSYVMGNIESANSKSESALAKSPKLVLDFEDLNIIRKKKAINWPLICTSLLFLLTLLVNVFSQKVAIVFNKILLILSGVLGLFLLFMWFGTNHGATRDNWNILWVNPLVFMHMMLKEKPRLILAYALVLMLGIAGLNCIFTFLPQFFHIGFLPIILSLILILLKEAYS